ncbi:hypothetical protein PX699_02160 [Sphingobium sp. H39-3-25]|uniref:hypothetical protein n=1 Tax=Sphingobium arseniciresistens TaxID=3030834 RepID=UPI0023B949F1|nr:hypothetical protein [Sphingobium arseniciresistens]
MSFKISWLAVRDMRKVQLLDALGFIDTGRVDEANEARFSSADLSTGWSIIWSNDFGWVESEALHTRPPLGRSIACQVHEGVMYSAAYAAQDGVELWRVVHDSDRGHDDLQIHGTVPVELAEIRRALAAEQQADGSCQNVDYMFDVPVEMALKFTGFRYDLWDLPSGPNPAFTVVERRR